MNINFQHLIPSHFNENSHVWVYQSSRPFTSHEARFLERILQNFTNDWKSHRIPVKGYANLLFGQFIILMAEEASAGENGFSTRASVKLIKNIEQDFKVELLDRLMLAFIIHEKIQVLPLTKLNPSIEKNFITRDTLYFNNTILTKKDLLNNWIIPVKESWLSTRIPEETETEVE